MRLIDADATKRRVADTYFDTLIPCVNRALDDSPTVDAVPVRHARWRYYHKKNIAVCTECSFERNLDANFGRAVCCPNCGAKMDN